MTQQSDYKTTIIQDGVGKQMDIKHTQRVDHIIDTNEQLAKESQDGKDMKLAARIPLSVIHYWEVNEGLDMSRVGTDQEMTGKFWKLLQSPEYAKLRVWNGRMV